MIDVPYMAKVLILERSGAVFNVGVCGGSIIHKRFILSAAHCAIDNETSSLQYVQVGSAAENPPTWRRGSMIKVEKILRHKDSSEPYNFSNDICLFKLRVPVVFGPGVALVKLVDDDFEYEAGAQATISGWGYTESGTPDVLRQVTIPLISETRCRKVFRNTSMTDTVFCAGSRNHGDCSGDSGGPLMLDGKQIGLVSVGPSYRNGSFWCGTRYGSIYLKVTKYLPWINETISKNL